MNSNTNSTMSSSNQPAAQPVTMKTEMSIVAMKNENGKVKAVFPLQNGEGVVLSEMEINKLDVVMLSGHDAFHPDVMVRTTRREIENAMESMEDKQKAISVFKTAWNNIKKVNTDKLFAEGGVKLDNFLNDIVLYYCARWLLFSKPMPAVSS